MIFDPRPLDDRIVAFASSGKCPCCGGMLDATLKHDVYRKGAGRFVDPSLESRLFHGDSGLLNWSIGRFSQNSPCSPLKFPKRPSCDSRGSLTLYSGKMARQRLHLECVKTAKEGKIVFLDGGNSLNVFYLRDSIEEIGADAYSVMENIIISRAFNFYPLTSLVTQKLPEALSSYHPRVVAVSDPTLLYEEEGADAKEAWYSFKRMA